MTVSCLWPQLKHSGCMLDRADRVGLTSISVSVPSITHTHTSSYLSSSQEIGWEERSLNDLFCDKWDVEP